MKEETFKPTDKCKCGYELQRHPLPLCDRFTPAAGEDKAPAHTPEIQSVKIWEVVKGLEANKEKAEGDLNEIRATLFVNFSGSREGTPSLVTENMNTISMLLKVLEYYMAASAPGLAQQRDKWKHTAEQCKIELDKALLNLKESYNDNLIANRDKQELIAVLTTAQKALKPGATVPPSVYAEIHTILNKYTI